jgi:hypothetical protein
MDLRQVRLTDPLVAPVIRGLTREYDVRYGEIDEVATVDAEEFDPPAGTFVVLIDGGEVLAGGGLRRVAHDTCEVKRMWTAAGPGRATPQGRHRPRRRRPRGWLLNAAARDRSPPAEAIALYTGRGDHRVSYYGRYPDALALRFDLHSPASPWPASETRIP